MAVINTGLVERGLKSSFLERLNATKTVFGDLTTRIESNTDKEKQRFLGHVPPLREWGTGRVAKGLLSESYDIKNLKYEATIEVDRDEISDDQTGQIRIRVGELAERAATHKDFLIGELLKNGHAAAFTGYDGVPFFSDVHVSGASGNQDNKIDVDVSDIGGATIDVTDPSPVVFKKAVSRAIQQMMTFKDDYGLPKVTTTGGFVCVVPPAMLFSALEAVNATLLANSTNVMQGGARIIPFPYLTAASEFFVLKTDVAVRPLIFQDREPIEFTALEQNTETGFLREVYQYGVRARYRIIYGYWQFAVKVTLVA